MSIHTESEYERVPWENQAVKSYLDRYFDSDYSEEDIKKDEKLTIKNVIERVDSLYGEGQGNKYMLGLPIHFALLAQRIGSRGRKYEPSKGAEEIFERYKIKKKRNEDEFLDTLTLIYDGGKKEAGIRSTENELSDYYADELDRLNYPNAPGHNTSKWDDEKNLLGDCFWLSEAARYVLVSELLNYGLNHLEATEEYDGNTRVRLFPKIISDYKRRGVADENAGLAFQAIAYGYFTADRPNLNIEASKVRTGSSRQKRIGDIDCYSDIRVELSVEVKDLNLTSSQARSELGRFIQQASGRGIRAIALVEDIDEDARAEVEDRGVYVQSEEDLLRAVEMWDWPKQDRAVRGMLHYLAHIEEDTSAVSRLQRFIHKHDADHDVLDRFSPENGETSDPQTELQLE